jgi:hypothetical protein
MFKFKNTELIALYAECFFCFAQFALLVLCANDNM